MPSTLLYMDVYFFVYGCIFFRKIFVEAVVRGCCVKKVLLEISKFTEKHLCQRLFFNKVPGLRQRPLKLSLCFFKNLPADSIYKSSKTYLTTIHLGILGKKVPSIEIVA